MRSTVRILTVLLSCLAGASAATAQTFPTRNITIVVPFAPGGVVDQLARELGHRLSVKFKQNVVIENVRGASTNIGTGQVARATPDGHTLLVHNLQIAANATLFPNQGFSVENDLTAVAFVNKSPLLLIGRKSLPIKNLDELNDWMKANVAKVSLPALGATAHLATAVLINTIGAEAAFIPHRGSAPAVQDVVGGQVDFSLATLQQLFPLVAGDMVKVVGITSPGYMAQLPGVPSMVDRFGPQLDITCWQGVFAPAGTPAPIVEKISAAIREEMSDPMWLTEWNDTGVEPFPLEMATPAGAAKFYRSEIARWRDVIQKNKITVGRSD